MATRQSSPWVFLLTLQLTGVVSNSIPPSYYTPQAHTLNVRVGRDLQDKLDHSKRCCSQTRTYYKKR